MSKSWILGSLFAVVLAAIVITSATADSKNGNGADCQSNSDCASGQCTNNKCKGH